MRCSLLLLLLSMMLMSSFRWGGPQHVQYVALYYINCSLTPESPGSLQNSPQHHYHDKQHHSGGALPSAHDMRPSEQVSQHHLARPQLLDEELDYVSHRTATGAHIGDYLQLHAEHDAQPRRGRTAGSEQIDMLSTFFTGRGPLTQLPILSVQGLKRVAGVYSIRCSLCGED